MVGKIPFVNNMSNRSDELLFVSIFSKSMFWSVAIIALRLVFIMLLVSLCICPLKWLHSCSEFDILHRPEDYAFRFL